MADLPRTVDPIEEDEAGSDEDKGPVLTGGFNFADLGSDDEGDGAGGWDFEAQVAVEETGTAAEPGGLQAKIRARLREKAELAAEDAEGDEAAQQAAPEEVAGGKRKKKGKAAASEAAAAAYDAPSVSAGVETKAAASHLATGIHFSELRLSRPLLRALSDLGFESPTPIQRDVVPPALQGLDVLATAETGSGKTASFLLPTLERLCQSANVRSRKRDASGRVISGHVATKALVLIPTRELAVQCHAMLRDLAKYTLVTYQLVAGGFVAGDQANALRMQPDIVVATPGRMLDHLLNTQSVHMELLEIVIFDEADRLLELGFREECQQVLKCCSKGRQTMLFSATHNESVEELAKLALVKPVRVSANIVNRVAETLEQEFVKAPSEELREAVLLSLVMRSYKGKVIVFCSTKDSAHRLAIVFGLCGLSFAEIHGNLQQIERVQALTRFQKGEANFLLATDLAARGLDLANVETVINFHLPLDVARYIHRVGRTARMGRAGRAVTIYAPEEYAKVKKLGRQCCSQVASKVLKRTIAAEAVETWAKKIQGLEDDIWAIQQDESMEREFRLADMITGKADNMQKYKASINARPAKEWFITNNEKRKVKDLDNDRVQKIDEEMWKLEEDCKQRREPELDPEEMANAKRIKRTKEKHQAKKAEDKAEREQAERRMRANARRVKKTDRPSKGGVPTPPHLRNKDPKNKKKKGKPQKNKD
mmetsp:Transcript_84479/g.219953  ORF Transcript_84479/g.219953 Transcript_84479/m.219953 type:complete len:712 (-) Transcript_84479:61-2196(-)